MENLSEIVTIFVVLWLAWALMRGLAFDLWGIGHEPGKTPDDEIVDGRTFLQRRRSRLYLAYPFMGVLIALLVFVLLS